jgi:hypothetical protein
MAAIADDDFKLSRIEAEGWARAQEYMPEQINKPDEFQIADLNPYRGDAARRRWSAGFKKAMATMEVR